MSDNKKMKTALVSVFHKDGLEEIITTLHKEGVQLLSTGGTQEFIESLGVPCQRVEDLTGSLTKKEFELLYIMLKKPGRVYSRQELLGLIWPNDANVLERSVDVNIARMRKKLGVYASYIVSRSGYGYCFDKSATE